MLIDRNMTVSLVLTKADKVKPKVVLPKADAIIQEVLKKGLVGTLSPLVHIVSS